MHSSCILLSKVACTQNLNTEHEYYIMSNVSATYAISTQYSKQKQCGHV